jgi:hypothetical protein
MVFVMPSCWVHYNVVPFKEDCGYSKKENTAFLIKICLRKFERFWQMFDPNVKTSQKNDSEVVGWKSHAIVRNIHKRVEDLDGCT